MSRPSSGFKRSSLDRRMFLWGSAGTFGAAGLAGPLSFMLTKHAAGDDDDDRGAVDSRASGRGARCSGTRAPSPYGAVVPVNDEATGLPLIRLPAGFRYISFSWNGDLADDGNRITGSHDGMGVVRARVSGVRHRRDDGQYDHGRGGGRLREAVLIRNHEIFASDEARPPICSDGAPLYDPAGGGGTVALVFRNGCWASHRVSIAGTTGNCAGGVTPWHTWLSCEEQVVLQGGRFRKDHGFIFESLPTRSAAKPVPAAGLFRHESVVVDPRDGTVYLTEDNGSNGPDGTRGQSGFYRFTPHRPLGGVGSLAHGGRLEALAAIGRRGHVVEDLRDPACFSRYRVRWVSIANPVLAPNENGTSGPFQQALVQGASRFQRLEGSWFDPVHGEIVFCDTEGGPRLVAPEPGEDDAGGAGAVWRYNPREHTLTNAFVSASRDAADHPDNLTVSPSGAVWLCEDGDNANGLGLSLLGLQPNGQVFEFGRNNIVLSRGDLESAGKNAAAILGPGNDGPVNFRGSEWAGATFDPTGEWLFVNIQDPGITFAITGPWHRG